MPLQRAFSLFHRSYIGKQILPFKKVPTGRAGAARDALQPSPRDRTRTSRELRLGTCLSHLKGVQDLEFGQRRCFRWASGAVSAANSFAQQSADQPALIWRATFVDLVVWDGTVRNMAFYILWQHQAFAGGMLTALQMAPSHLFLWRPCRACRIVPLLPHPFTPSMQPC